ncbi:MAG: 3-hydroxyacyl-CoA dehydrogenase family protein [Chitinophagales bacterium]
MKKPKDIKVIAIIGAGTMGSGIALLSSQSGFETILYDVLHDATVNGFETVKKNLAIAVEKKKISAEEKEKTLSRIKCSNDFHDLIADVMIEAIVEKLEVKSELFTKLAVQNDSDSIFCTNTSSIPITKIAASISHPERVVGMHFFNPAHLMKLVEVVSGEKTSAENAQAVYDLAKKFGKEPVMARDAPGFIVNRIGKLYHTEPLKILEEKIASVETIDALLESSGFKIGPFKLIDLIGVDANLNVTKSLYELFNCNAKFKPGNIQQQLVDSGFLGKKTGRGFYQY